MEVDFGRFGEGSSSANPSYILIGRVKTSPSNLRPLGPLNVLRPPRPSSRRSCLPSLSLSHSLLLSVLAHLSKGYLRILASRTHHSPSSDTFEDLICTLLICIAN